MIVEILTELARSYLIDKDSHFVFRPTGDIQVPQMDKINLYIHIPFCKNLCPYCPYNKIRYDKKYVNPYLDAMLYEIEQYYLRLGSVEISSIYIGGGTPTNLIDELGIILERINDRFEVAGDICIETNPGDINGETVRKLEQFGIDMVSLGIQSFDDKYLRLIGRNYHSGIVNSAINRLRSSRFKSLNFDLMFALPGQTKNEVLADLQKAFDAGADQVTLYPLFTFPYSGAGKYMKLKKVKLPNLFTRREMYRAIHDFCQGKGYYRVSVWGFKRGDGPRFSSVTRDLYIGLGAGAGSHIPGAFYFNTFSVEEYIETSSSKKLPIALKMGLTDSISRYYWLYWRFYDTYIPKKQFSDLFKSDRKIHKLLWIANKLGLCNETEDQISLTEPGSFWIHLIQNYYILNYINRVWTVATEQPWPRETKI
jgi:coproporphyrinogen III oxidase-like Fe-S oxidoreductase